MLDASVLIAFLDARDKHHDAAVSLLENSGAEPLAASSITLAEALVMPMRSGMQDDVLAAFKGLGVVELPVGSSSATQLAELRARTGLKMPDCYVIAAAEDQGGSVATFDKALGKAAAESGLQVTS